MLTVMCPNCRLRFPAPGCCNPEATGGILGKSDLASVPRSTTEGTRNDAFYGGGYLLMPREYGESNTRGCFINAPTIINGPTIIQQPPSYFEKITGGRASSACLGSGTNLSERKFANNCDNFEFDRTTCDMTGGSVTITTPRIQSGGCLIRSKDSEILVQSPRIEIRPKHTGCGGYVVQKRLSLDETSNGCNVLDPGTTESTLPSGCQFLPGIRLSPSRSYNGVVSGSRDDDLNARNSLETEIRERENRRERSGDNVIGGMAGNEARSGDFGRCFCAESKKLERNECTSEDTGKKIISEGTSGPMEIRVNATVQLPPNVGHCTVNITATTGNPTLETARVCARRRDNFNGGGLISFDQESANATTNNNERREDAPSTPISWLMSCPWGFGNYPIDKDVTGLMEIKRLLQTSGWYHEGLSWQQSETLLKNAPIGRWLMRDSSDSRFTFAVSVQTNRGPTSVRVLHHLGKFRLDAEPRLVFVMPLFDCPIKMLEYYVEYSKRINERKEEVWVDHSGQPYSQIYLTTPLVKDVQSLSHLARVVVNRNKLNTENLPPLIKNYLAEYPYSL